MTVRQLLLLSALLFADACAFSMAAADGNGFSAPQALLVKFQPDISDQAAAALLIQHGAIEASRLGAPSQRGTASASRWWVAKFAPEAELVTIAAALRVEPWIEAVEVEQTYHVLPESGDGRPR